METIIHKSDTRGFADHGWLVARHSFSFADYYNPDRVHFGLLRVLNDDIVHPGMGFGTHPHDNMEIITIPLVGSLEHKDSMGHIEVIKQNEVQVMSAGTGITHSEYNASKTEPINLFQIWIFPKIRQLKPRYDQRLFNPNNRINKLQLVVSPDISDDTLWINQDARLYLGNFKKEFSLDYSPNSSKHGAYIMLIEGELKIGDNILKRRDAIGIWSFDSVKIQAEKETSFVLIEVPME